METNLGDFRSAGFDDDSSRDRAVSPGSPQARVCQKSVQRPAGKSLHCKLPSRRKVRKGEWTCTCAAYRFPHRFGGGNCDGSFLAVEAWESSYGGGETWPNWNASLERWCAG